MGHSGSSCTQDSRSNTTQEIDVYARASRHQVLEDVCTPYDDDLETPQPQQVLLDIQRKELAEAELEPATVILHIYDVNATLSAANKVLAFSSRDMAIGGAFHTGLEAYGSEWSYGTSGVTSIPPRTADHIYRCSLVLGQTTLIQWVAELHDMCQTWSGQDYDLLGGNNCNSFVADLCRRLGVGPVPPWVDRLSRLANRGKDAGKRVFRAASEARSRFVKGDRDKIAAELDPQTHRVDNVVLRLPQSQIAVQGQRVALERSQVCTNPNEVIQPRKHQEEQTEILYVKCRRGESVPQESFATDDTLSDAIPCNRSQDPHSRRNEKTKGQLSRCDAWNEDTLNVSQLHRFGDLDKTQPLPCVSRHIPQLQRSGSPQLQRSGSVESTQLPSGVDPHLQACLFTIGSSVEYFSSSLNCWVVAQVLDFDSNRGLYELTCKSQVPAHKMRTPQLQMAQDKPSFEHRSTPPSWFPPGHSVEYESASAEGCWIPAVVVAYYADTGLYDLDCKGQVPREKIRPVEDFPISAEVEYRSTSAGQNLGWIPGVVLSFDDLAGLYDLTCKAKVARHQIRWPKRDNV